MNVICFAYEKPKINLWLNLFKYRKAQRIKTCPKSLGLSWFSREREFLELWYIKGIF